ncbi:MAG: imidazole glycerol phosphate synthase subunit HisF [Bacteroidales bacterium]|nr:imidazole glycerol phosphate synthase subunit HisF [Bacteroidales bacterium]
MVAKRIIPCLDVHEGETVKGVNFVNLRVMGDPVEMGRMYSQQGADELVYLDISATNQGRGTFLSLVRKVADTLNIPFTVGGGISTADDASRLLDSGADKISLNSAALKDPTLIEKVAARYGSQFVVVAIDAKLLENSWRVMSNGGRNSAHRELFEWANEAESRGAGEILFTSMDNDGTKKGFAVDTLAKLCNQLSIPVIASGGAGKMEHFSELFLNSGADAALAASVFHEGTLPISSLKKHLSSCGVPVRIV